MFLAKRTIPRTVSIMRTSSRGAAVQSAQIPTGTGKVPPTLEEFDPLNPGEWQLGASGKILPRLPEGTKCGKLVMGKYGLYDPKLRKQVELYSQALQNGAKSEEARPFDRRLSMAAKLIAGTSFIIALWNLFVLFHGKLIWPYAHHKAPGQA
ncbi:hypothetical protein Tcan_04651 [Toxocara canis]|uniref:Uncharacterized protein n=2 Tax=Toxocara canis TaxID=6265 RepID=A0A0B2VRW8_TOXCA|nr:hypothetical protein Tcan_04651 [Toxocara canis]VDM43715.1 unnamed protein product [Toxocara canis]